MEKDELNRISDEPKKIAHLQMIQGVIDRMAGNLFFLKGWAITLLAALFAISASNALDIGKWPLILLIILLFLFWVLDGYFLSLERCFRDLYDKVRSMNERDIDFSMNIGEFIKLRSRSPLATMFRPTLLGFYGTILVSMLIVIKLTS
tara:strand:+ start:331 stop:774 length:444 start_codon:yes stop_codon:yes gene_type:complete